MTKPSWAMILAAGLGTRLMPLTKHRPKPSLELCARPIIYYQLDMLVRAKISHVAINIHHHESYMREIIESYPKNNINIHILHEENILGTAGGITNAVNKLNISDNLLIIQGDIIIDFDLENLFGLENFVTLLCIKDKMLDGYVGNVGCNEDGIITVLGRYYRTLEKVLHNGFFTGVHLLSKEAVYLLKNNNLTGLVDEVYPRWLEEKKPIKALMAESFYDDLGSPDRLLYTNLYCLSNMSSYISPTATIGNNVKLIRPYIIHAEAIIENNNIIGPLAIIGACAQIKSGAIVEKSVVMSGTIVKENEKLLNTIALINERVVT